MDIDRASYRRQYYINNREKAIADAAAWKKENAERVRAANRKSAAKMRAMDPERFNEAGRRWRNAHPGKANEASRRWHERNPNYWREWRLCNLQAWLVKSARARAKEYGLPFSLTRGDIVIPEFCPALGIKLDIAAKRTASNSIALDRLVPEYGYVPTNVRVISRRANMIKSNATASELEAIAAYVRRETGP